MIKPFLGIDHWMKKINNPKHRMTVFISGFVSIYFIWIFLLLNPLLASKKELADKIQTLQLQQMTIQQQINGITQVVNSVIFSQMMAKQKFLTTKIHNAQQKLAIIKPMLVAAANWIKLKKSIISEKDDLNNNIVLVSLHDLPIGSWLPNGIDPADLPSNASNDIYQHQLELEFQADYFSTITYLSRLEKLPWPIYWESLQYKVLAYPKADVIIKFHIFTDQKSEQ
jgi:MSHA biogenesis protein MshJ